MGRVLMSVAAARRAAQRGQQPLVTAEAMGVQVGSVLPTIPLASLRSQRASVRRQTRAPAARVLCGSVRGLCCWTVRYRPMGIPYGAVAAVAARFGLP